MGNIKITEFKKRMPIPKKKVNFAESRKRNEELRETIRYALEHYRAGWHFEVKGMSQEKLSSLVSGQMTLYGYQRLVTLRSLDNGAIGVWFKD